MILFAARFYSGGACAYLTKNTHCDRCNGMGRISTPIIRCRNLNGLDMSIHASSCDRFAQHIDLIGHSLHGLNNLFRHHSNSPTKETGSIKRSLRFSTKNRQNIF